MDGGAGWVMLMMMRMVLVIKVLVLAVFRICISL
jgi:hypothetical protein